MDRMFEDSALTGEEAHKMLLPHYDKIMRCIRKGISSAEELRQREPEYCEPLKPRSWASNVHDHMESEAKRIFGAAGSEIAVYANKGFVIVEFEERIILRFKKLSQILYPYSIKTIQQRAFDNQTLFQGSMTLVTAGYRLNELGFYRDAHIVCWTGNELLWSLRLPDSEQAKSSVVTVPLEPKQPTVVVRKKIIRKAK